MNDSSFNGFYTEDVQYINHQGHYTNVFTNEDCYVIQLACIDSVTFEDANLAENDNLVGKYRIYKYENTLQKEEEPFIEETFKNAYFDNRAILITSKTGDFGIKDTIMIYSDFYKTKLLLFTDDNGEIWRIFDGNYLLDILYKEDGNFIANLQDSYSDKFILSMDFHADNVKSNYVSRGVGSGIANNLFRKVLDSVKKISEDPEFEKWLMKTAITETAFRDAERLLDNIVEIDSNPELHNQKILFTSIQVGADVLGILGTVGGGLLTGGALWTAVGVELTLLQKDITDLFNTTFPDSKTLEKYQDFYKNRYAIDVFADKPSNITDCNATLNGTFCSAAGLKGKVYFYLWEFLGNEGYEVDADLGESKYNYAYPLSANIDNLKPKTEYCYSVVYEATIDGLTLTYRSEQPATFITEDKKDEPSTEGYVDLGLSVKWSSCNLGASTPEHLGKSISGTHNVESLSVQLPTPKEIKELEDKCTHEYMEYNGVKGVLYTGPNGNSIFIPLKCKNYMCPVSSSTGCVGHYWFKYENGKISCYMPDSGYGEHDYLYNHGGCEHYVRPICK